MTCFTMKWSKATAIKIKSFLIYLQLMRGFLFDFWIRSFRLSPYASKMRFKGVYSAKNGVGNDFILPGPKSCLRMHLWAFFENKQTWVVYKEICFFNLFFYKFKYSINLCPASVQFSNQFGDWFCLKVPHPVRFIEKILALI